MFALLKNKTNLLLLLIILFGGIVRFLGVNPGFNQYHSDEGISYSAAVSMIKDQNLDPLRYDYPAVVPIINYVAFKSVFIPISWVNYYRYHFSKIIDGYEKIIPTKDDGIAIFKHDILGDREINALFWGRYTTAFISTLSILLIFLLGKRLVNYRVGLIAAFLLAINFRSVTNSHIGLPDTYNAFFLLLSLLLTSRLFTHRTKRDYILAGLGIGLSLATKYQTFIVFPFLFAHFVTIERPLNYQAFIKKIFDKKLFIAGFVAAFTFFVLNPYLLIHLEQSIAWVSSVSTKYAMGRSEINLFPLHYWLSIDYGILLFTSICLGSLFLITKKPKIFLFLLAELAPFLFVMLYYSIGGFYVRNFITITPIFLVLAAFFISTVIDSMYVKSKYLSISVGILLLCLVSSLSINNDLIHTINYQKPWNYQSIQEVARKEIPNGSIVVGHPFDPLPSDKSITRIPISTAETYSLQEIQSVKGDFAYINLDWAADPFYGWMTRVYPENVSYVFNKPYREMRETFWGLSIEELLHFVVGSKYKPWQAPEAALFIVKVPKFSMLKSNILKSGEFLNSNDVWKKTDSSDSIPDFLQYDENRKALQIGPGSGTFNISRFVSPEYSIKEGYLYQLSATLFSESEILPDKKNVFLRVDYYDKNNNKLLTSLSQRFWGKSRQISFVSQAPKNSTYLQISLQATNALLDPIYLKSWELRESTENLDYTKADEISFDQYKDILYPNSHGNL